MTPLQSWLLLASITTVTVWAIARFTRGTREEARRRKQVESDIDTALALYKARQRLARLHDETNTRLPYRPRKDWID